METTYQRMPVAVEAVFQPDGSFKPKKLFFKDNTFEITRILRTRRYCPRTVRAIATWEYTVVIDSQERQIYYEPDTNQWFSVKEVHNTQ